MKPTMNELWSKKGNFVNTVTGAVVAQPEEWFPICAGPWPNRNIGARQVRCTLCNCFAGLSPMGFAKHAEEPEQRPILCGGCLETLIDLTAEGADGSEAARVVFQTLRKHLGT
jgi:hypothetical protein